MGADEGRQRPTKAEARFLLQAKRGNLNGRGRDGLAGRLLSKQCRGMLRLERACVPDSLQKSSSDLLVAVPQIQVNLAGTPRSLDKTRPWTMPTEVSSCLYKFELTELSCHFNKDQTFCGNFISYH